MFDSLSERLQEIIKKTAGNAQLSEENMQDALREIRRALLGADVSLGVVKSFISNIKDKALGQDVIKSVNPSQMLIKIVNDELVELLGKEKKPLKWIIQKGGELRAFSIGKNTHGANTGKRKTDF